MLGDYLPWCEVVEPKHSKRKLPEYRDPADLHFLQLVLVANADRLISGDKHLLVLRAQSVVTVVDPGRAKAFFGL